MMTLHRAQLCTVAVTAWLLGGPLFAQQRLPTVAEATAISKTTGRPIFAMAGRET